MIKGKCHTNLDEYRHKEWPTIFADVPVKGEKVEASDGASLEVVQITHSQVWVSNLGTESKRSLGGYGHWEPRILVELHRPYLKCKPEILDLDTRLV